MTAQRLPGTPNLRELIAEARRQGAEVTVNRQSEVRVVCPAGRVNVHVARKDGTRAMLVLLRKNAAMLAEKGS